jgi:hypothetical protein
MTAELVNSSRAFYVTRRFLTMFTRSRHRSLPLAASNHFIFYHASSVRPILILSSKGIQVVPCRRWGWMLHRVVWCRFVDVSGVLAASFIGATIHHANDGGSKHLWNVSQFEDESFLDIAPCSFIGVDWRFRGAYCLHRHPDVGISTQTWNVGLLQRNYTSLYPRKVSSPYSPPWQSEVSRLEISTRLRGAASLRAFISPGPFESVDQNVVHHFTFLICGRYQLGRCCSHDTGPAWLDGLLLASHCCGRRFRIFRGLMRYHLTCHTRPLISAAMGCYAVRNTHIASVPCTA